MTRERVTARLSAIALLSPLIIGFAASAFIGSTNDSTAPADLAIVVRLTGVLQGLVYLAAFVFLVGKASVSRISYQEAWEKYYVGLSALALFYFVLILPVPAVLRSTVYYTIGDLYKAILPFIGLIVLSSVTAFRDGFRRVLVETYVAFAIALAVLGAFVKFGFLLSGSIYGSGMLQYSMGSFVLAVLLMRLLYKPYTLSARAVLTSLLLFMLLMSVMSLKRGVWVALFLTALVVTFFAPGKRVRAASYFGIFGILLGGIVVVSGLDAHILARLVYTFGGEDTIDRSTYARLAEVSGALRTLADQQTPLIYMVGMGHGAEFAENPEVPMTRGQTGSAEGLFHHIHSTPFLLLFRYGILGGLLYVGMLLPVLAAAGRLYSVHFRTFCVNHDMGRVFLAMLIQYLTILAVAFKGNVLYGSISYSITLSVLLMSYTLVRREYLAQPA